jgi:hypothetical protein
MTTDKLNPSIRCPLFSSRRTVSRGWLTELIDRCRHRYRLNKKEVRDADAVTDKVTQEGRLSKKSEIIPD